MNMNQNSYKLKFKTWRKWFNFRFLDLINFNIKIVYFNIKNNIKKQRCKQIFIYLYIYIFIYIFKYLYIFILA